jgi:hypothetical protein
MTPNKLDGKKFSIMTFLNSPKIFICETQILKVKRIKICKSNNPAKGGGLNAPQLALGFHTRDIKLSSLD